MSELTRNISNLPNYYFDLNPKQKRNCRRNIRKIERNEELKLQHPPYHPLSNIIVIHLHHQTEISAVDQLIKKAEETERYALDTESQKGEQQEHGALIQIQMIHSINHSTIILIEIKYLPDPTSLLYQHMRKLWSTIFGNNHEVISWGSYADEIKNFKHLDLIQSGKTFKKTNLQLNFQEWKDGIAHPEMESRDNEAGYELYVEASDDDDIFNYDIQGGQDHSIKKKSSTEWSLQEAVAKIFNKFLDKTETKNYWQCGIDLHLGTWKQKLFSKKQYDKELEQDQRLKMTKYAVHDCTVLPELYFHIYPEKASIYQEATTASSTTRTSTSMPTLTTTAASIEITNGYVNQLPDIEHELIEALKPKFNQPAAQPITTTTTTSCEQKKKERQRRKNEKFKLKKKYDPKFNNKILRPIYYRYNYRKIRAQLLDDKIFTSHQITINHDQTEVMIGFKTNEEKERAKSVIKINYFTREQYIKRWSGR